MQLNQIYRKYHDQTTIFNSDINQAYELIFNSIEYQLLIKSIPVTMNLQETAKFRMVQSYQKSDTSDLKAETNTGHAISFMESSQDSKISSFDLSEVMEGLSLQIIDLNDDRESPKQISLKNSFYQILRKLKKNVLILSEEAKKLKEDNQNLKKILLSKDFERNFLFNLNLEIFAFKEKFNQPLKEEISFHLKLEEELEKQINILKKEVALKDKENQMLSLELKKMHETYEKKDAFRLIQLHKKELQWQQKIDEIIKQFYQLKSNGFKNQSLSNAENTLFPPNKIRTNFHTLKPQTERHASSFYGPQQTTKRRSTSRQKAELINRISSKQKASSAFESIKSRINNIECLLKEDLSTFT